MNTKKRAEQGIFYLFTMLLTAGIAGYGQAQSLTEKEFEKVYGKFDPTAGNELSGLNFLLITSDQQHWMAMGYNDPNIKTPNLDRLAKRGVIFDRAYCPNPTCTPARASLITGQLPSQHGAYVLGTKLPEAARTVGAELSMNGYETALVGKAHFQPTGGNAAFPSLEAYPILQNLAFWKNYKEPFYGFTHVELTRNHGDEPHVGQHYVIWMEEKLKGEGKDPKTWRKWFRAPTGSAGSQYQEWNLPEEYHMNYWIAERTNALLEDYSRSNKPFLLWASFFDPHPPYLVSGKWAKMYNPEDMELPGLVAGELDDMPEIYQKTQVKGADFSKYKDSELWSAGLGYHRSKSELDMKKDMAIYFGMVSMMDYYIGKILNKVEALGIAQNTVIVFTTDHGHLYGQHGLTQKGPFMYEDLVKVPMVVSCPGLVPERKRSSSLQSLIDIAPTFLNLAGIAVPGTMTGTVQSDVWKGQKESVRDFVIVENHQQPYSLYQKQLVTERYKLTIYMNDEFGELFDLKNDPNELKNLWHDEASEDLKNRLILKLMQSQMKTEPILVKRLSGA